MVQSQEEEAGSQAFDVILYLFVLGPAVEWCLKSPRVNRGQPGSMRGMALAITLLAALALGKLAYDMAGRDTNHFEQLGVRVDASAAEIRKAHKALSLSLHGNSIEAPAFFAVLRKLTLLPRDPRCISFWALRF